MDNDLESVESAISGGAQFLVYSYQLSFSVDVSFKYGSGYSNTMVVYDAANEGELTTSLTSGYMFVQHLGYSGLSTVTYTNGYIVIDALSVSNTASTNGFSAKTSIKFGILLTDSTATSLYGNQSLTYTDSASVTLTFYVLTVSA